MATVYVDKDNYVSILLDNNDTVSIENEEGQTIIRPAKCYSAGRMLIRAENFCIMAGDK